MGKTHAEQVELFRAVEPVAPRLVAASTAGVGDVLRGLVVPGFRLVGLSKGQISILDLIEELLVATGPADVTFSTWTMSDLSIDRCGWLMNEGRIRSLTMLVDRSFARCKPERALALAERFGRGVFLVTRTHAKFALLGNDDWHVCVRTSANLNRNPRFEQFDIDDNLEIFDFFAAHVAEIREMHPQWDQATSATFDQFERALGGGVGDFGVGPDERTLADVLRDWRDRVKPQ